MDNLCILHPDAYSSVINESRKLVLHPLLAELIKQKKGIKLLDYGCGDGSFIRLLNKNIEVSLFDISNVVLSTAKKKLKEYSPTIYYDLASIPKNHFDYVVFSLVIMTIGNKKDIKESLTNIHSLLKPKGEALIAFTHPCFRQQIFSTFQTAYSEDKNFNYFKEGDKFKVHLRDSQSDNSISFYDYHWTLSTTMNLIIEAGLSLTEIIELQDKADKDKFYNSNFSPYMILRCCK